MKKWLSFIRPSSSFTFVVKQQAMLKISYKPISPVFTSGISDAHNATNTVKFKWKYRTPQFPHTVPYPVNIFDDPFARPFD